MLLLNNFSISINTNPFFIVLGFIVFAVYTYFILKFSLPKVTPTLKFVLISLRTLSLTLILFLIFEPVIVINKQVRVKPKSLIFVDNSKSIAGKDSSKNATDIKKLINLLNNKDVNPEFYFFGNRIDSLNADSLKKLKFNESSTNFENILSLVKSKKENIADVIIISDGQITEGENPVNDFEKLGIPFYTIGVGDTTQNKDIMIKKVIFNRFIYQDVPTELKVFLKSINISKRGINLSLYENSKLISKQKVSVNSNQLTPVVLNYTPKNYGDMKLTLLIDKLPGEESYENNKKAFFVNVLKSKLKLLLISGSPSEDVSFIKQSLQKRKEIELKDYIQFSANKFSSTQKFDVISDSTNILLLVGFPSQYTPVSLIDKVYSLIQKKNIPFLIVLSTGTDLKKLSRLKNVLNFNFTNKGAGQRNTQLEITDINNSLFKNNSPDPILEWNSLPPVQVFNAAFIAKKSSRILAVQKINNIKLNNPLIISSILGSKRSISILASGIWKWKLQLASNNINLFDNFIYNSVQWLNLGKKQKRFNVYTSKKIYSMGDKVEFSAQLYDDTMLPLDNASVEVNIMKDDSKYLLQLNSIGNGNYEGQIEALVPGDYKFVAKATKNGALLGTSTGKFNIGDVDIEKLNIKMNISLLRLMANNTGGKFFLLNKTSNINKELSNFVSSNTKIKIVKSELRIWNNKWILISIILLFGLEWFLRKRFGML